jgi:hypothetical protein
MDGKSPMPNHISRPSSISPGSAMQGVPQLQRQNSDYYMAAMNGGMATNLPAHLRNELNPQSRSGSPAQYQLPSTSQAQRPPLTSNPSSGYNPPQILEPPAAGNGQGGSGHNSPHMSAPMGWQSPHNPMAGNGQHQDYAFADTNGGYAVPPGQQMYYQQRPHSTGPLDYQNQMGRQDMQWAQHHS